MKQPYSHKAPFLNQKHTLLSDKIEDGGSQKLLDLNYLLQKSKISLLKKGSFQVKPHGIGKAVPKDLSLYVSLVKKPINLLFSLDQFLFEFSKKTYQQKKTGEFLQQLKERKKLSFFYGHLSQKTLTGLFRKATQSKGFFSKNLLCLLERRLDVVVFRSGFAQTIAEARQRITHKKVLVNGKPLTFPTYQVEPGDVLSMAPTTKTKINGHLLEHLKTRPSPNHTKMLAAPSKNAFWGGRIQEDFFSKLTQNLQSLPHFSPSPQSFQSKLVCILLIQFLCTQLKNRASYVLKGASLEQLKKGEFLEGEKGFFLTLLKWKLSGLKKRDAFSNTSKAPLFKNRRESALDKAQRILYPELGYVRQHPLFWSRELINSNYSPLVGGRDGGQPFQQKNRRVSPGELAKRRGVQRSFRESFLLFLKQLEKDTQFQGLVGLHFHKFMSPKLSPTYGNSFSKTLVFRVIKPLHLEISYNLFHVIYLFSPQRVNFPFFIDLDLIRRSLR